MLELSGGYAVLPSGVKKDISIIVEDDRILDIGPSEKMRAAYKIDQRIGSPDSILCPGFIDAHMHSSQIATRGLTSDKSLLDWLKRYIWKWEGAMDAKAARACSRLAYLEMLKSGTTSFVDYTSVRHTEEAFRAAREIGLRGTIGKTMMDRDCPKSLLEDTDESLKETERLIRRWHNAENGRLRYSITPRFGLTCTDELLLGCKDLMERYAKEGVIFTTHAHESGYEIKSDKANYHQSAIEHFHKLGLLGRSTLLTHCIWLTPKEKRMLSGTGTAVAHCPGSNMMLSSGAADLSGLMKAKIPLGLGTDMGAYYNMGMFDQMRLSALLQKVSKLDPNAWDHDRAFRIATEGGARAIGLGKQTGALAVGRKADILVLSGRRIGFFPRNDIVSQLVYAGSMDAVSSVVCDGKLLMQDGRALTVDEDGILDEAEALLKACK